MGLSQLVHRKRSPREDRHPAGTSGQAHTPQDATPNQDKALADRCQIVLLTAKGNRRANVAESVGRSVSWVNRVVARFDEHGVAGLLDRREDRGAPTKVIGRTPFSANRTATASSEFLES